MIVRFSLVILLFGIAYSATPVAADEQVQQSERFGTVKISSSEDEPVATIIWFSEDGSFTTLGKAPAFDTIVAAAVKVQPYIEAIRADNADCSYVAGEIVRLGQSIQSDADVSTPTAVWVGGEGLGASLAYAIYAQRPQDFLGLVGFDFCPDISQLPKLCQEGSLVSDQTGKLMPPPTGMLDFSYLNSTKACADNSKNLGLQIKKDSIVSILSSHVDATPDDDVWHLGTLRLIPVEVADSTKGRVLFFSGDGGWAALDKEVSLDLALAGYEVYGVDSLRYFWKARDFKVIAGELATLLKELHDDDAHLPVYLTGYSFGADILPHIVALLDPVTQGWVKKMVLLNPEQHALPEVHVSEWLGVDEHGDEIETAPVARTLTRLKPYCICSAQGEEPLCSSEGSCQVSKILPGDHHFDGDFKTLSEVMLSWMKK